MGFLAFFAIFLVSFGIHLSLGSPNTTYSPFHLLSPSEITNASLLVWGSACYYEDPLKGEHTTLSASLGINWESYELLHQRTFFLQGCPAHYPTCYVTTNPAYAHQAKALLFHWRDLENLQNPDDVFPKSRPASQLWALLNIESPVNSPPLNTAFPPFNLTVTYQADSDIPVPYGKVVPLPSVLSWNYSGISLQSKTQTVTWFVSNCQTAGHREAYVDELSAYIDVRIYGNCGNLICSRSVASECYAMAARDSFFYLSFENSICRDYVTEKVFNILAYDIVPVVFGGANYSAILPPHSYIDATQMRPLELAELLRSVSSNSEEYLKYFAWRATYSAISLSDFTELYCGLCREMETSKGRSPRSRTVEEINEWYLKEDSCWQSTFWKEKLKRMNAPNDAEATVSEPREKLERMNAQNDEAVSEPHFVDY